MKNRILKLMTFSVAIFMVACQESDNAIDAVFDGTTKGAIIRTVSLNSGEFNSYDLNSAFDVDIEVQDEQNGGLMEKVNVYLGFKGTEVLATTLTASSFTTGPFGLPRANIRVTLSEAVAALGLSSSQYTGGDALPVRLELVLTDGRVFSGDDASGSLQGSYTGTSHTGAACFADFACPRCVRQGSTLRVCERRGRHDLETVQVRQRRRERSGRGVEVRALVWHDQRVGDKNQVAGKILRF